MWGLQEAPGLLLCWKSGLSFKNWALKSLVHLLNCLLQKITYVWDICKSLTVKIHSIFYFCWGHQLLSCLLDSVQSQTPGRKERTTLTPPRTGVPLGTGGLSYWMETRRGDREAMPVFSFQVNKPGSICWVLTSPFHTFFFSVHLTNVTVHQSLIFLSESLEKTNKLKSSFTKHSRWTLLTQYWTWANIRLINSPQHALRVTAFSWSSVRRRLLHESLFKNLISNILITYNWI